MPHFGIGFAARIVFATAATAVLAVAWFGRVDSPELSVALLLAAAGFGGAFALRRIENKRRLGQVRAIVEAARHDLSRSGALEEAGPPEWQQSAHALNAWIASLRERHDDETVVRDRLETVIGALEEAVLVVSREGRVLFANGRLGALFVVPKDPVGRTMLEVVREPSILGALDAALRGASSAGETRLGASGQLHVRYRVSPYPAEDAARGEPVGAVALFHDVSELRRAESARSDFLANASHEIKTPLSAVRGYAEILADRDPADPTSTSKRAIEAILNNAKRLTALVEDLLELSRIEGGSLSFDTLPFDAGEVTRSLLRDFAARSRSVKVEISLDFQGDTTIVGDRRAYEQVVGNLVDNALKYTPAGGAVRLCTGLAEHPDRVRVEVHDNGNGISLRHQDRVFERFYRVDPGRSRNLGGTGLGLAIVKHLVQGMGGDVGLISEPGKGSCFWVELPRRSGRDR